MTDTEARIQQDIVVWFRNNYCTRMSSPRCSIFSVPNERESRRERIRLHSIGMLAGVSDLIVVLPDRVLFVEVKDATGTQSKAQKEFEIIVRALNHQYLLVRSLDEFKKVLLGIVG